MKINTQAEYKNALIELGKLQGVMGAWDSSPATEMFDQLKELQEAIGEYEAPPYSKEVIVLGYAGVEVTITVESPVEKATFDEFIMDWVRNSLNAYVIVPKKINQ